jgi:hypothetical protein
LSIVVSGGAMLNIPFEWERAWMWDHPMVPFTHTEQFGKAVIDDEFDTIVTLVNASAAHGDLAEAELDLDIYSADGQMARFRNRIPPNTTLTPSVGELVRGSDLPKTGFYSVWIYCRDRSVQGFHILQRRKDHALGAQHFYYGRFNALESDLPIQVDSAWQSDSPREDLGHTEPKLVASRVVGLLERAKRIAGARARTTGG